MGSGILCRSARKLKTPISVVNGGTNLTNIPDKKFLYGENWGSSMGFSTGISLIDQTTPSPIERTGGIATERYIYNGLPTINESNFSSNNTFYAPTDLSQTGFLTTTGSSTGTPYFTQNLYKDYSLIMDSSFSDDGTNIFKWYCFVFVSCSFVNKYSLTSGNYYTVGTFPNEIEVRDDAYSLATSYGYQGIGELHADYITNTLKFRPDFNVSAGTGFVGDLYYPTF